MRNIWKIVCIVAAALIVLGILLGGVGLFTGASADRLVQVLFGSWDKLTERGYTVLGQLENIWNAVLGALPF